MYIEGKPLVQIKSGRFTKNGRAWIWRYKKPVRLNVIGNRLKGLKLKVEFVIHEGEKTIKYRIQDYNLGDGYDIGTRVLPVEEYFSGRYPEASNRLLTDEDLNYRTFEELAIMRNEILARYGLIFKEKKLKEYFGDTDWYEPQHKDVSRYLTWLE